MWEVSTASGCSGGGVTGLAGTSRALWVCAYRASNSLTGEELAERAYIEFVGEQGSHPYSCDIIIDICSLKALEGDDDNVNKKIP